MKNEDRKPGWLMGVIKTFASENEFPNATPQDNQIALSVESNYNNLKTIFQIDDDENGYEHYTPLLVVPDNKRMEIAEEAISSAYKEISPVLPKDDNRLFIYGNATELQNKSEDEIRNGVLDVMGRVSGYDNEKHPIFKHILSKK